MEVSPLAPHRVRFAPQNRLFESADCSGGQCWARDFCIVGTDIQLKAEIDRIWDAIDNMGCSGDDCDSCPDTCDSCDTCSGDCGRESEGPGCI